MSLLNASSVGHASKPYGRPYDHEASLGQFVLLTDLPRARSVDNMNVASVADIHASVHGGSVCLLSAPPLHSFARRSLQSHETTGATISRPRCALIAARTALTSSMQQAELTHSEGIGNDPESDISTSELRSLWDRVGKPLLRVGKGGVQASHTNSLRELLYSHTVIKVQINQHDQKQVVETCQQLAVQSSARLLQLKGRTALFMQANADVDVLRHSSSSQRPSENHQASQRHLERVWHNDEEADSPVQLHSDVQSQLQFLTSAGVLSTDELDKRCLRSLSQMPDGPAVTLLKGMSKTNMRGIRNKSAWLNSQCKRITAQAR